MCDPAVTDVSVYGVSLPVSVPSSEISAPVGAELTEMLPVCVTGGIDTSVKDAVAVDPVVTVTDWDAGWYPVRFTDTVWLPAATEVSVYGVTSCVSVPSSEISAPDGAELTEILPVWGIAASVKSAVAVDPVVTLTDWLAGS